MRAALPSRSPTTVFSWHRATRTRGMTQAYRRRCAGKMVEVSAPVAGVDVETVVREASRSLSRLLDADETARSVLDDLDLRVPVDQSSPDALVRSKQHEFLRIA